MTYRQMLERSDALGESRGRGIGPAQIRDSIDLPLENAREDRLSNGNPDSATDSPRLQTRRWMQRLEIRTTYLRKPKAPVDVAMSFRGIAACRAMRGG
jgi:hypothetical protein